MAGLSHEQLTQFLLALGLLLGMARLLGELALRFHQPAVLGELLAGVLLGPTILGRFAPELMQYAFPQTGNVAVALNGLTSFALALFLLVAGMEVDLSTIWRQGRAAAVIGVVGLVVPFVVGWIAAGFIHPFLHPDFPTKPAVFAMFFATALSISALPVIVKTLMDLSLYRTDFGMVVVAAAILNDLVGWIVFAFLLSMLPNLDHPPPFPIWQTILMTLAFTFGTLTLGRMAVDRAIPWIQAHASWPAGVLGFAVTLGMLCAAFTNWIGIHPVFGTFLAGVALGDSRHLRERTRATIDQFISCIFAPLFFASVGLKADFFQHFNLTLTLVVVAVATVGKVFGGWAAARWAGYPRSESWAIGWALNSRGAMEIILGLLALEHKLIDPPMFVALVVMALATSMTSGNFIRYFLEARKPVRFTDHLSGKAFLPSLKAADCEAAIRELVAAACEGKGLDPEVVTAEVWRREQLAGTSVGLGVALPHAGLENLAAPIVAVGLSADGVDFDAPDGLPATLIFLILTPRDDRTAHLDLVASISSVVAHDPKIVQRLHGTKTATEFLAAIKTLHKPAGH